MECLLNVWGFLREVHLPPYLTGRSPPRAGEPEQWPNGETGGDPRPPLTRPPVFTRRSARPPVRAGFTRFKPAAGDITRTGLGARPLPTPVHGELPALPSSGLDLAHGRMPVSMEVLCLRSWRNVGYVLFATQLPNEQRVRGDFYPIPCSENTSQYLKRHFNNPNKQPMDCEDSE